MGSDEELQGVMESRGSDGEPWRMTESHEEVIESYGE